MGLRSTDIFLRNIDSKTSVRGREARLALGFFLFDGPCEAYWVWAMSKRLGLPEFPIVPVQGGRGGRSCPRCWLFRERHPHLLRQKGQRLEKQSVEREVTEISSRLFRALQGGPSRRLSAGSRATNSYISQIRPIHSDDFCIAIGLRTIVGSGTPLLDPSGSVGLLLALKGFRLIPAFKNCAVPTYLYHRLLSYYSNITARSVSRSQRAAASQ